MKIKQAKIVAVTAGPDQYPPEGMPEIAFAGRSNVGKSSLLNLLTNRKGLAKVSASPGKTRTINFYEINGKFRIVDLPGYGYAKLSKQATRDWGVMMEEYLEKRASLIRVIQLVDIRHKPTELDIQMHEYLTYYGLEGIVVATKADKISKSRQARALLDIRKSLGMREDEKLLALSALKRTGVADLLDAMSEELAGDEVR